jgi:hypothetical protein
MAGRINLSGRRWLAVGLIICAALTGTQARAAEQIQRYNFELHCAEPLLGSRWQQPQHEVYRMLDSLEEFKATHPHAGVLDAKLYRIWREGDFQKQDFHHRAFLTLVVEDESLHAAAQEWIPSLAGIQPDSIKPELCDKADPFAQWPPVDIIINGTNYHYPGDFSPLEREWAAVFAQTNYPNQALFIVHPDERSTGRFGLGELSRADTFGEGQAIVIKTLQEEFDIGELEFPAGMDFYPQFLPTHLVPESDEELHTYLLGQLESSISNYAGEQNYGNLYWEQFEYPLSGNANEQAAMAATVFSGWLAKYPQFASGKRFGECSMRVVRDAAEQPRQITLRLNHIGIADRQLLLQRFSEIGMEPSLRFGNSPPSSGWFGDRQLIAEHGFLLRNLDNRKIDSEAVQQAVDSYIDQRADTLPLLAESSVEIDTKQSGTDEIVRMKISMPSTFELGQLKDWVAREVPLAQNWQIDHDVWQREDPSGAVLINGRTFSYPDDFAGIEARQLASLLQYGEGQRVLAILEGIDYQPLEDPELAEKFSFGDLAMLERSEDGLTITTLEQSWDHGVDIASLDIPQGFRPHLLVSLPLWYGNEPADIREFAREALAGYKVHNYDEMIAQEPVSYRQIIANPIPGTRQRMGSLLETAESLSDEEKLATLTASRQAYDTVLQWLDESEDYSAEDLVLGPAGMRSDKRVAFNANEFHGFVQQIQIGLAGATDEQLVELMDRIHLATGMRDIWAMGNLFPSLLLDDPQRVNAAAQPMTMTTHAGQP